MHKVAADYRKGPDGTWQATNDDYASSCCDLGHWLFGPTI